ncbi:MAG: type II toxin-antitoxin system PemK/MazF family toxin [Bryobacteraceae bacterium]
MTGSPKRLPRRGEIWFVKLRVDPPGKGLRPVVIVSVEVRNRHERADTVLAIPLTTSIHKDVPTHVLLSAAETGLPAGSNARAEDITVIRKASLVEPRSKLRQLSHKRICGLARAVEVAMGCAP